MSWALCDFPKILPCFCVHTAWYYPYVTLGDLMLLSPSALSNQPISCPRAENAYFRPCSPNPSVGYQQKRTSKLLELWGPEVCVPSGALENSLFSQLFNPVNDSFHQLVVALASTTDDYVISSSIMQRSLAKWALGGKAIIRTVI